MKEVKKKVGRDMYIGLISTKDLLKRLNQKAGIKQLCIPE